MGSPWAGSRRSAAVLLAGALLGSPISAAEGEQAPERGRTAEVRIGLPGPSRDLVSVRLSEGSIVVEVPRDAVFPLDFEAASEGLLRAGEVASAGPDRRRLTLRPAAGLLEEIRYEADALVLRFRTRVSGPAPGGKVAAAREYRLGPEDRLQISVNGQPEYTRIVTVGPSGTVAAPLVGEVGVAGLTLDEFTAKLTDLLARDYLVDPRVDVQVVEYRSHWVVVTGAVQRPGRVPLKGGTELKEVLAEAGGFSGEAGDEIVISRPDPQTGESRSLRVDRAAFERGEPAPALEHGDVVHVPRAAYCYVYGEVRVPQRVRVERGLTLLRAITLAGGLTDWANKRRVLIRKHESDPTTEAHDLKAIEAGRAPDPPLSGGEVIIVERRFL